MRCYKPNVYLLLVFIGAFTLSLIADQVTKGLIETHFHIGESHVVFSFLSWVYFENFGVAFSLLGFLPVWGHVLLSSSVLIYMLWFVYSLLRDACYGLASRYWSVLALGLILGGGIGNLWDRLTLGAVTDFLLFHWRGYFFPAFNLADTWIFLGALCLIVALLLGERQKKS